MKNNLDNELLNNIKEKYLCEKSERGVIFIGKNKYYYKIQDLNLCKKEIRGYLALKEFYPVPEFCKTIFINRKLGAVVSSYESTIKKNRGLLVDLFSKKRFTKIEKEKIVEIINLYKNIFKKTFVKSSYSASDIFFKNRIKTRINKFYPNIFLKKSDKIPAFFLNNEKIELNIEENFLNIKKFFKNKKKTWCVVSQCDPNDLNIGTKPIFFDYLAGGKNPLMAEFATLFWYNLVQ